MTHHTTPNKAYSAPAAACSGELLKLLAQGHEPFSVAAIARTLGRSRSLVFRVLHELEAAELVERHRDGRYWLGISALELGGAYAMNASASDPAARTLCALSDDTGETSSLAVLSGSDIVYVQRHEGRNSIVTVSYPGKRLPATCTALGKALLAELPERRVRTMLPEHLPCLTSRSIDSLDRLLADLQEVRERGYAIDDGETLLGRTCIGVAVLRAGQREPAAISVSAVAEAFAERKDELLAALLHAKRRLDSEHRGLAAMSG